MYNLTVVCPLSFCIPPLPRYPAASLRYYIISVTSHLLGIYEYLVFVAIMATQQTLLYLLLFTCWRLFGGFTPRSRISGFQF